MSEDAMRVLLVHNHYQQPGGEDQVFAAEGALLEAHGHEVIRYTDHNDRVAEMGRTAVAGSTIWNRASYRRLRALIREKRPRVAHFHNTFPLISPAAYYAARAEGVSVVQTLHNYRLFCPDALFFREGRVCEDCLGKAFPWPGIIHSCYRDSTLASGTVAAMLSTHRILGTWRNAVDRYVALTEFSRDKFVEGGLPPEKIVVKPNFIHPDPGPGEGKGDYVLFVGRLSTEKGLDTMLAAAGRPGTRYRIVGDGPLGPRVAEAAKRGEVEWLGRQPKDRVLDLMKDAAALIFPSIWYEGFPMVIVEAYATGLPVIASDMGNMASLIDHGHTGLRFQAGDPVDLDAQVRWMLAHPAERERMRRETRAKFEAEYSAERNYGMLLEVYRQAAEKE